MGTPSVEAEYATVVIDGWGKMALPGFVNTHHHFFQQLTRAVPAVHCAGIRDWLRYLHEPLDFLEEHGWLGPHVWLAHCTSFSPDYVRCVAQAGTGISHSPSSNMRLGYAAAPVPALAAAGAKVSIGVDGGASNDTGDYLGELRHALLVHRIRGLHPEPHGGPGATSPYEVLAFGTRGGAAVLNRDDLGSLEPGKAADLVLYDLNRLGFAGALHDPLAALLLCGETHLVDMTMVNGEILVRDGHLTKIDERSIVAGANRAAARLIEPLL